MCVWWCCYAQIEGTTRFEDDMSAFLMMMGDMAHDILLITMSSDHRFIAAFQKGESATRCACVWHMQTCQWVDDEQM